MYWARTREAWRGCCQHRCWCTPVVFPVRFVRPTWALIFRVGDGSRLTLRTAGTSFAAAFSAWRTASRREKRIMRRSSRGLSSESRRASAPFSNARKGDAAVLALAPKRKSRRLRKWWSNRLNSRDVSAMDEDVDSFVLAEHERAMGTGVTRPVIHDVTAIPLPTCEPHFNPLLGVHHRVDLPARAAPAPRTRRRR